MELIASAAAQPDLTFNLILLLMSELAAGVLTVAIAYVIFWT